MTPLAWELSVAIAAWAVSSLIVLWTSRWAARHDLVDIPINRSSHTRPKPRLGGVGIVVAVSAGCLASLAVEPAASWALVMTALIALAVGGVSLADDLHRLPALPRLAVHTLAAVATIAVFGFVSQVGLPGGVVVYLDGLGLLVSLVWIVGFINAFNFMDGLDGIAGTQAMIAGVAWAAIGWLTGQPALTWAGLLLAGSALGFLGHNWQPSTIFLGDVGATYLGYWIAAMPFLSRDPSKFAIPGVLVAWPFVFDVIVTLIDRLRRREHLLAGHKRHFYQRLNATGFTHAQVSLIYAALSTLGAIAAVAFVSTDAVTAATAAAAVAASALGLQQLVQRRERHVPSRRAAADVMTDAPQGEP
jgi:UDP-N-acetylmuramyl pentapeptide phosphotransferase/UDP-N-acetylglucosamine-1-phosphate transferase